VYNVRDGVIIVNRLDSVKDQLRKEILDTHGLHATHQELERLLPRFHTWSDMAYDGWSRIRYKDLNKYYTRGQIRDIERNGPKGPRYLILQNVSLEPRSMASVNTCMKHEQVPRYPGKTFGIGSLCFNAILSTRENTIFAELMGSQKKTWGLKTLAAVRVFRGDEDENPTFLWPVHDYDEQIQRQEVLAWAEITIFLRGRPGG